MTNRSSTDTTELALELEAFSRSLAGKPRTPWGVDARILLEKTAKAFRLLGAAQTPAYLEDLAQWADAAVELFPVHGERFQEIARVLRTGAAQTPGDATDDICQCVTCGRMHRRLGTPPPSVMEQIARDMREGTFPKKSEQTQREDAANAVQAEPQPGTQPPLYNPDDWGDPSAAAAQAALNPGIREALERIRDFPIGGHTAAGAMALIARQALASLPPSQ